MAQQQHKSPLSGQYRLVAVGNIDRLLTTALRAVIYLEDLQVEGASRLLTTEEFRSCQVELHDAVKAIVEDLA